MNTGKVAIKRIPLKKQISNLIGKGHPASYVNALGKCLSFQKRSTADTNELRKFYKLINGKARLTRVSIDRAGIPFTFKRPHVLKKFYKMLLHEAFYECNCRKLEWFDLEIRWMVSQSDINGNALESAINQLHRTIGQYEPNMSNRQACILIYDLLQVARKQPESWSEADYETDIKAENQKAAAIRKYLKPIPLKTKKP